MLYYTDENIERKQNTSCYKATFAEMMLKSWGKGAIASLIVLLQILIMILMNNRNVADK